MKKVIALVDIFTTQNSKIEKDSEWVVDYIDDSKSFVWIKKEGVELPAGDTFISIEVFNNFFNK